VIEFVAYGTAIQMTQGLPLRIDPQITVSLDDVEIADGTSEFGPPGLAISPQD
jgi:hypothetical protein